METLNYETQSGPRTGMGRQRGPKEMISIEHGRFAIYRRKWLRKGRRVVAEVRWECIDEIAVYYDFMGLVEMLCYVFRLRGVRSPVEEVVVNEVMGGFNGLLMELETRCNLRPYLTPEFDVPPVTVWTRTEGPTLACRADAAV